MSSGSRKVLSGLTATIFQSLVIPGPRPRPDAVERQHHLDSDPHQRHGDQRLPAEPHDLVVAVAREGGAEPEEEEQEYEDLEAEPEEARLPEEGIADPGIALEGSLPAAEEEHRGER